MTRPIRRPARIDLAQDWAIQSSAKAPQKGDEISTVGFDVHDWYPAGVPSTVIGALVNQKVYPDPYFGMNLRSFPGMTGDIGDNLTNLPMPPDSPFAVSWWYRTEFHLPGVLRGERLWLNFDSINCRANIWLNGRRIAGSDQVRGMYRMFEFDVTGIAAPGANALAVEVFAPTENDFTITYVDWNPLPPDKDMGLVRDVYILTRGPVAMRNVQVVTQVDTSLDQAHLTLFADLKNGSSGTVTGTLEGDIGTIAVSKQVRLAPGESARVAIGPRGRSRSSISATRICGGRMGWGRRTCNRCIWNSARARWFQTRKTWSSESASSPRSWMRSSIASSGSTARES